MESICKPNGANILPEDSPQRNMLPIQAVAGRVKLLLISLSRACLARFLGIVQTTNIQVKFITLFETLSDVAKNITVTSVPCLIKSRHLILIHDPSAFYMSL